MNDYESKEIMINLFGEENFEINSAPFLVKALEEENSIRFIVALPVQSKTRTDINDTGIPVLNKILKESFSIYPDENNLYEILFEDYVFHITRNESYTYWDDYEIRNGKYFIIFDKSRLLDYLPQLVEPEIVTAYYPNRWKHYGIYCQNHIIDVIATKKPKIKNIRCIPKDLVF